MREESGVRLRKVVLVFGTDECIIHANDSHMFRLSESPTNITRFPLHFFKNASPSNLHLHFTHMTTIIMLNLCIICWYWCWCYIPWDGAWIRLPRVLKELFVWSAELETVKLAVDERTLGRVIERVRSIEHPSALEQVTSWCSPLLLPSQWRPSTVSRDVAAGHEECLVGSKGLLDSRQDCDC